MTEDTCYHKPQHLFTWYARDDSAPDGRVLVIVCKNCHTILKGRAPKDDTPPVPPAWVRTHSHRARHTLQRIAGKLQAYGKTGPGIIGLDGEYYLIPADVVPQLASVKGITFPKRLDLSTLAAYAWQD